MPNFVLDSRSVKKILDTAGSEVETLSYFESRLNEAVKQSKSGAEYASVLNEVPSIVENAKFQEQGLTKLDIWSGRSGVIDKLHAHFSKTEFSAFQDFMATRSANIIPAGQYRLDCIVNDLAEFKRAYSKDGNILEGSALDAMDTVFNAWIAQSTLTSKSGLISKDGVIYRGNEAGEPVIEVGAAAIAAKKAVVKELNEMLSKTENGFQSFVQEKNPGVQIDIIQHEEPEVGPEVTPEEPASLQQ